MKKQSFVVRRSSFVHSFANTKKDEEGSRVACTFEACCLGGCFVSLSKVSQCLLLSSSSSPPSSCSTDLKRECVALVWIASGLVPNSQLIVVLLCHLSFFLYFCRQQPGHSQVSELSTCRYLRAKF